MFKYAVDGLTIDPSGGTAVGPALALTPAALIVGYGAARAGSALCNELRNATFAKVGLLEQPPCQSSQRSLWHPNQQIGRGASLRCIWRKCCCADSTYVLMLSHSHGLCR